MSTSSHPSLLALALACFSLLRADAAPAGLKVGDAFPDLSTFKLEGELPQSLKGKVVLVDFWASWCAPCAASFPVMDALASQYSDKGLIILAVSVDEKRAAMEAFLKKHPVSFSLVRDSEHKLVAAANAEAMPTSFLLDRKGAVRFIHKGFKGEETKKKYVEQIEQLLEERS